ncbi:DUF397 domain-containing protein [Spirillospora sp. NPDC127200]
MGTIRDVRWRKSSFSVDGDCVEVAAAASELLIRDSTRGDAGGVISISGSQWAALLDAVRAGLGRTAR